MNRHTSLSRQKLSIKRLLGDLISKQSSKSNDLTHEFVEEDAQNHSLIGMASCSSSTLKRNEEVMKDQGTSTDPTLENQQFFYMPVYRRYFGLTPPNPRVHNRRLRNDYIDWYMNVYLDEEFRWERINISNVTERVKQDEEEVQERVKQFPLTSYRHRQEKS